MRNLKPFHILLGGSALVGILAFVLLLILYVSGAVFKPIYLAILPFSIAVITYAVFYIFIKKFLTQRLRLLYRSIRKGKFEGKSDKHFKMSDDVISAAEEETRRWSEEQHAEILTLKEQALFRREFLGNLAHELKTPVFSIQGYILTLLDGGLEDEKVNRMFLERASKATDRMSGILEDLDLLMKFEVNEIHLDIVSFDIKELVREIFEDLEMKARKKGIELRFAKEFNPLFVRADRGKIGQVLSNLLNNTISYGNKGGESTVRFYIFDDLITVEVSDNGLGIDEVHLPRLFERFYRVEKSRNRNEGGSGLGLAIAKHIIEAHDQTISVRSTPDVGSTFTFGLDKANSN